MVVPGVVGPVEPCHVIVQPPDWVPMSSAPEPASSTSPSPVASGSRPAVVLSSTADFPTASRASVRSWSEPSWASSSVGIGCSNRPSSNLTVRIRVTASSIRDGSILRFARPASTAAWKRGPSYGTMTMSMPADDRGRDRGVVVRIDLVDAGPVGDHEAAEPELALQHLGEQAAVAMDLAGAGARERGHHDPGARVDRGLVGREVDRPEGRLVDVVDALVDRVAGCRGGAPRGPAVADEMLGGGRRRGRPGQVLALESRDERLGQLGDLERVLAVALEGAAPADVLRHRHDRSEVPADAGGGHLERGRLADPLHQVDVVRRAEPDLLGEDRGARDVVVAVDGVDAVEHRDAEPGVERRVLVVLDHPVPAGRVVLRGGATAAAQDRAEQQVRHALRVDRALLELGHLPDLLLDGHLGEESRGAGRGREGRVVPVGAGRGRRGRGARGRRRRGRRLGRAATRDERGGEEQRERRPGSGHRAPLRVDGGDVILLRAPHRTRRSRRRAMEMRTIDRSIAFFLPAAAALTIAVGIAFLAVQQDLRIGANDVPQQLAEDAVAALDGGADPTTVVTGGPSPSTPVSRPSSSSMARTEASSRPTGRSMAGPRPCHQACCDRRRTRAATR